MRWRLAECIQVLLVSARCRERHTWLEPCTQGGPFVQRLSTLLLGARRTAVQMGNITYYRSERRIVRTVYFNGYAELPFAEYRYGCCLKPRSLALDFY
ncbi:hypothetical protein C8Q79DRAFT_971303 [Trametes meyenii]|nr:hypothetical protein C8Q79DRAFT_971303 [Trametes meyenii]